jgi:hypothetical protein
LDIALWQEHRSDGKMFVDQAGDTLMAISGR